MYLTKFEDSLEVTDEYGMALPRFKYTDSRQVVRFRVHETVFKM